MDVRVIPTKAHALLDYTKGPALVAVPTLLRLEPRSVSAIAPRLAGAGGTAMGALSNHELAVRRLIPMRAHLLAEGVGGVVLAAAPWLSGSARRGVRYWLPHALVGASDVVFALTTRVRPRSRMERLRGALSFVPRPAAIAVPAVVVLALGGAVLRRRRAAEEATATAGDEAASENGGTHAEE